MVKKKVDTEKIKAAGAVVWRKRTNGIVEIAIIHRPKYDDWSLPKGKLEIGESAIAAAYREVLEETNLDTQFGPFLDSVNYFSPEGEKQVDYWAAKYVGDENAFVPNQEVDQMKWLEISAAADALSHESDQQVIGKFLETPFDSSVLILLRHGKAVSRDEWRKDDSDRPLDDLGRMQANRLISTLQVFNIAEIHTSDAVRCFDTIYPFAKSRKYDVKTTKKLSEDSFYKDKDRPIEYVKDLLKSDQSILVCSHNPIIPKIVEKISKKSDLDLEIEKLQPGDAWVIHHAKKVALQIDKLIAPIS
jgi:phosphohistidine phosphatase SixA/8-oxo-dGTP pyrophosphatase MutT (NUDIX family)